MVWGLGFGFGVWGLGFRVWGSPRVQAHDGHFFIQPPRLIYKWIVPGVIMLVPGVIKCVPDVGRIMD